MMLWMWRLAAYGEEPAVFGDKDAGQRPTVIDDDHLALKPECHEPEAQE